MTTETDTGTSKRTTTPLLDRIIDPSALKALSIEELSRLAEELRAETIEAVSVTGGHLGAGLGVVELTLALHAVFDAPTDAIIWDVGHQSYPHKILTGRRDRIRTLRRAGGLSGFTRRSESVYDPFGAAHAGTSISAGLGFATARDLKGEDSHVVCVVGDGAMTAGMIYEAMNHAGGSQSRLIVILNDNDMSIAPPVGALSHYLSRIVSSRSYRRLRKTIHWLTNAVGLAKPARKVERYMRDFAMGGGLFDALNFYYVGPVDGHDIKTMVSVLRNVRAMRNGPVLVHAVTRKGKGYLPAETASDKYHGVSRFNVVTGEQDKGTDGPPSYTAVFARELIRLAKQDDTVLAITAAMPSGTGLDSFAKQFPARMFDVGIAEQHAVTFAAGLAARGMTPFAAIYSTFLQRAYDSVIHDVAIQKLPVRFAIDRAGLVGADGPTHAGSFDIGFLGQLPGFILMAAADERELQAMIATAHLIDDRPSALRYPRGPGQGIALTNTPSPLDIGRGRMIAEGSVVALLSYGARLHQCLEAAGMLAAQGLSATVCDARFAKPLDHRLIGTLAREHEVLITVEEGAQGGFGAFVLHHLANDGYLDRGLAVRTMTLPDLFLDQGKPDDMYRLAGLDACAIAAQAISALGRGDVRALTEARLGTARQ